MEVRNRWFGDVSGGGKACVDEGDEDEEAFRNRVLGRWGTRRVVLRNLGALT